MTTRIARVIVALCAAAAAYACGGGSSPTSPAAGGSSGFRIAGDAVVTLDAGQSLDLRVEDAGRTQDASQYQWTSSDSSIVAVTSTGQLRAGPNSYGQATVTARSASGATAAVLVWVQLPQSRPSTYRITFVFAPEVNAQWREAYAWAGEWWAGVIRSELPAFDLTNHVPCRFPANIPAISGVETGTRIVVLHSPNSNTGGPCTRRAMPHPTTALGVVEASHSTFLDFDSPFTNLRGTAMHEIGHVLGLAGMSGINGEPFPWFDPRTSRYTGALALEGYRRVFGVSVPYIETRQGDWHWGSFTGDMMTTPPSGPLTSVSAGSLMDIGYPAAWYGVIK